MSIQAPHTDARDGASRQGSLAEFLSTNAEEPGEPDPAEPKETPETDEVPPAIAQRDDLRDDIDWEQEVAISKNGTCYHKIHHGLVCSCLGGQGTTVPLWKAVLNGMGNCGRCGSIDVKRPGGDS